MAGVVLCVLLGPDGDLEDVAVGFFIQVSFHFCDKGVEAHAVGDHERAVHFF